MLNTVCPLISNRKRARMNQAAHHRLKSILQTEVDWTTFIDPTTKVHVVHGGLHDRHATYDCATHLQSSWQTGLVWADTVAHLQDLVRNRDRVKAKLLVATCAEVIHQWPQGYDVLASSHTSTVLLSLPLDSINGKAYSSRSDIVVIVLPSCRVDPSNLQALVDVYRFPSTAQTLGAYISVLPHGYGLTWKVGRSSSPTFVSFTSTVTVPSRQQEEVDRAFWWTSTAAVHLGSKQVPVGPFQAFPSGVASFTCSATLPPLRLDSNRIGLTVRMSKAELIVLRSNPIASGPTDFHLLDDSGSVLPVQLTLGTCIDGDEGVDESGNPHMFLSCPITFFSGAAVDSPAPTGPVQWRMPMTPDVAPRTRHQHPLPYV